MNPFTEKTSKILMMVGIVLFLLGLFFFLWDHIDIDTSEKIDASKFGQFGDFVGGLIGSLWAFAGVILFYVALTEQRDDIQTNRAVLKTQVKALEQQINEFALQREELELTRKVFIDQSKTLKLQQFESTFFNMINLHHQIVNSMDITTNIPLKSNIPIDRESTRTSRDCFNFFMIELENIYRENLIHDEMDRVTNAYKLLYVECQSDLGHYFRNLYNILKFIDKKNQEDKFLYSNLLRAQLSSSELLLLFYNGISEHGNLKFKPLIEKYHFLQNIPKDKLLQKSHLDYYCKSAFAK